MKDGESYYSIKPRNPRLHKLIEYYYFHDSTKPDFYKRFLYHPHYNIAINAYRGINIEQTSSGRTYVPASPRDTVKFITINKHQSRVVEMNGVFEKIGIIFKPLGINYFLDKPLSSLVNGTISQFDAFDESFDLVIDDVYEAPDFECKARLLDHYFLSNLNKSYQPRIDSILSLIFSGKDIPKVTNLASRLGVSRATLLRLFKKELSFSVEEFITVVKFRRALHTYQHLLDKPKLTHLALDAQYYDQADFIRRFKKITGYNPKKFFSNIQQIGDHETYWVIQENIME